MLLTVERRYTLLAVCTGILIALTACATSPPVQEMSDARQAITAAENADAETLAPELLERARELLLEAERLIEQSAYGPARANAVRAKNRAVRALSMAQAAAVSGN